ncbi:GNAT family N-acetyltransferase [Ideonella livida]|uniref:GNAT family N-acetyltransferase n=1 Tax=Ideonella livida TaxID=2707176 RepID=A0A7C9PHB9_9BURK|nr:GNAT family N-acetyltransferase [Ideonella livida]NDY91054.1 GNAT family N-acetyltransferase [Ideonella livida]
MPPFPQIRLQTPRLLLRPLQPTDAPALWAIYADAEFMRYWSSPPWTSLAQAQRLIEGDLKEMAAGEHVRLGLFLRTTQALVGTGSLFHLHHACRRAELGYGIARPHWRRGLMHEGVGALIDWAFGPLGLHRLEADIDPRNLASAASLRKLGFVQEGLLRERWIVGSEVSDSALYGLLAREWAGRGPGTA